MRLYNLIYIAANTADQEDVWIRKNRMEDIADAPANDNGNSVLFHDLQPLPEGKIIQIKFLSCDFATFFKFNQQDPGAGIKNRWNTGIKNGYGYGGHNVRIPIRWYFFYQLRNIHAEAGS